jgi:hypothetical protein
VSASRGQRRLEEAVKALQNALLERTRERAPLQCAKTEHNFAIVSRVLEERRALHTEQPAIDGS